MVDIRRGASRAGLVATNSIRGGKPTAPCLAGGDRCRFDDVRPLERTNRGSMDGAAVRVSLVCFAR